MLKLAIHPGAKATGLSGQKLVGIPHFKQPVRVLSGGSSIQSGRRSNVKRSPGSYNCILRNAGRHSRGHYSVKQADELPHKKT